MGTAVGSPGMEGGRTSFIGEPVGKQRVLHTWVEISALSGSHRCYEGLDWVAEIVCGLQPGGHVIRGSLA